jgi:mRNA-degrading endonuclease RelE of RelBE toxin-antitoxin system
MYEIRFSNVASSTIKKASAKERELLKEALRIIARDPFDRSHVCKLRGEWEGCYRIRKGDWRIIYRISEEGTIYVLYVRRRTESTYK